MNRIALTLVVGSALSLGACAAIQASVKADVAAIKANPLLVCNDLAIVNTDVEAAVALGAAAPSSHAVKDYRASYLVVAKACAVAAAGGKPDWVALAATAIATAQDANAILHPATP